MSAIIIDGRSVAEKLQSETSESVQEVKTRMGIHPCLSVCLVGDDPASAIYVRNKQRACEKIGIGSTLIKMPKNISQAELSQQITDLSSNPSIHGILVQLPLPSHLDQNLTLSKIDPRKDVDGFHPENLGKLFQGEPRFVPCTPLGILTLSKHYKIPLSGKNVVIINDTIVVGKPLCALFLKEGATVSVCHVKTQAEILCILCRNADIIVTAVGKRPKFSLKADYVKKGAAVFDVGINRLESGIIGDVEFDEVKDRAGWITPCPGGVGPLTISMLLQNTVKAAKELNTP